MKALRAGVIALTLVAVPTLALAAEPPAPAASAAAPAVPAAPAAASAAPPVEVAALPEPTPAPAATPLATRPSKPLTLANTSEGTPFVYKLLAGLGVAAAAGLWLKKKRGVRALAPASRIDVLGRTSVGVRSELLVVEVEGTRLLVGMTPSAIQTLAVLDAVDASSGAEAAMLEGPERDRAPIARVEERPMMEIADRARSLLGGARQPAKPAAAPKRAPAAKTAKMPRVAGQAKGLLLALEQPKDDAQSGAPERRVRLGDW
ncbi:MAG: flagellar biosynthetic protein FliO [Labilithrix sp.]|nr:flagellar biosynthetic protein FliO [Labilithrix sp.]